MRTYASEPVHSISFICRIIVVFLFAAQGRTDARVHTLGTQGLGFCTREPRLSRPPRLAAWCFCAVADSGKWYEACESQTRATLPPERTESRGGTAGEFFTPPREFTAGTCNLSIDYFYLFCQHRFPSVLQILEEFTLRIRIFSRFLESTRIWKI